MNLENLRSLQSRIRESKGADRELDLAVGYHLCGLAGMHTPSVGNPPAPYTTDPDGLGACVALLNELLPGYRWSISGNSLRTNGGTSFGSVSVPVGYEGPAPWPEGYTHHDNACLALLYAICSAKIAELEAREKADA